MKTTYPFFTVGCLCAAAGAHAASYDMTNGPLQTVTLPIGGNQFFRLSH
jgi:hypothetical protein